MTAVYAISLISGVFLLLAWVASVAVAETVAGWDHVDPDRRFGRRGRLTVAGWDHVDPDRRFGRRGRLTVAGLAGFGLGGMSASYAGWPAAAALAGAVGGAVLVGAAAYYLAGDRDVEAV